MKCILAHTETVDKHSYFHKKLTYSITWDNRNFSISDAASTSLCSNTAVKCSHRASLLAHHVVLSCNCMRAPEIIWNKNINISHKRDIISVSMTLIKTKWGSIAIRPMSSNNWEKLRCHTCDPRTDGWKVKSSSVFCENPQYSTNDKCISWLSLTRI